MPPKTFTIKRKEPTVAWERPAEWGIPMTLGEEVEQAVLEWYGRRGQTVPADEVGIGAKIDRWEREADAAAEKAAEKAREAEEAAPAGEKPEFGTPAFWAWARKRKAEKDAERAAKGLPPLPTKREKEAAAAAKKAAAAAKK